MESHWGNVIWGGSSMTILSHSESPDTAAAARYSTASNCACRRATSSPRSNCQNPTEARRTHERTRDASRVSAARRKKVPKMGRTSARCACESLLAMSAQDAHNSRTELRKSVEEPWECAMCSTKARTATSLKLTAESRGVLIVRRVGIMV